MNRVRSTARRRASWLLLAALGSLWCAAYQKRKQPKPPEIEIVQIAAQRSEGLVTLDGRVRNRGERPAVKLTLNFDLLAPGGEVLTSKKGTVEPEVLDPEDEAEFHWQLRDPVRAVSVRIHVVDGSGNEVLVRNPGPFPIE